MSFSQMLKDLFKVLRLEQAHDSEKDKLPSRKPTERPAADNDRVPLPYDHPGRAQVEGRPPLPRNHPLYEAWARGESDDKGARERSRRNTGSAVVGEKRRGGKRKSSLHNLAGWIFIVSMAVALWMMFTGGSKDIFLIALAIAIGALCLAGIALLGEAIFKRRNRRR